VCQVVEAIRPQANYSPSVFQFTLQGKTGIIMDLSSTLLREFNEVIHNAFRVPGTY
jgi:hypothetical protein